MKFKEYSCNDFIQVLSSSDPVPGGGGASALVAAVGTALSGMVGSLTVGKKKYADVEEEIRGLMDQCVRLQEDLLTLIDRDAEVFYPLSQAYRLPRETEEEREYKASVMEKALLEATNVPLLIMEKCCEAIDLAAVFAEKGSVMAVSDAGVSASCLRAALNGASLNVFINTRSMKDRQKAEELEQKADRMLKEYIPRADRIFEDVLAKLV